MAPKKESVEDDPVVATYDVLITPELQQKLYLLQFPTQRRGTPYNEHQQLKPSQMRVKPRSGFVELDVPIPFQNYDPVKAKAWKKAMTSAQSDGVMGHGMASGFAAPASTSRSTVDGNHPHAMAQNNDMEEDDTDQEEGISYQTLAGQISREEVGKPLYMIGTFRQNQLHLTKLDAMVQLRPQFHYIDAMTQLDRNRMRRDREVAEAPKQSEPRVVQQSAKSADAAAIDPNSARELLEAAQEERWSSLGYRDEEEDQAYELYHDRLFFNQPGDPPKLASSMDNDAYLDRMSAPRVDSKGRARVKPLAKRTKVQQSEVPATGPPESGHGEQQ